jgi:hypothetical protein
MPKYNTPPPFYYETQKSLYCGKHALNNLLGSEVFTTEYLNNLCNTFSNPEKHCNMKGAGDYSDALIIKALNEKNYNELYINSYKKSEIKPTNISISLDMVLKDGLETDNFVGLLIVNNSHWIAVKKSDGYWLLDSINKNVTKERDLIVDIDSPIIDDKIDDLIEKIREIHQEDDYDKNIIAIYQGKIPEIFGDEAEAEAQENQNNAISILEEEDENLLNIINEKNVIQNTSTKNSLQNKSASTPASPVSEENILSIIENTEEENAENINIF